MTAAFTQVLNISISACYLIVAVIVVRFLFKKLPKSLVCVLWMLVGLRLVIPALPESSFSLLPNTEMFGESEAYENLPVIRSGYERLDASANAYLQEQFHTGSNAQSISPYQIGFWWGTVIWTAGMLVLGGYFIYSWLKIKRGVKFAVPEDVESGRIYRCEEICEPFLFGIVRPKIYVPWNLSGAELKSVILHEKGHMERGDHIFKPVFYLILILHWFNPLVWAAYILLCKDIEYACDEKVMKALGEEGKAEYSGALLACSVKGTLPGGCPVAFGEGSVKSRIQRILSYKKPAVWVPALGMIICIVLAVCFMTGRKVQIGDAIVYGDYKVTLTEATACEDTQMIKMQLQITSDTAEKEAIEEFGNMLDLGVADFSHGSSGSMLGDAMFIKNFEGSYEDIEAVLKAYVMGEEFAFEEIGGFSEDSVQWEDAQKFEADSSLGKVVLTISPSTMKIECPATELEKHKVYVFVLHMASGERWKAARVPFGLAADVGTDFDTELYYGFNVEEVNVNIDTGETDDGFCWKYTLKEKIDPKQIVSVSVEEVSLGKK
ncbi:MAG: hypothetical protein IJ409_07265 [Lachnospiraceae bacterium]|nr:hypothetical protein [Lachnospiraceae bacterium]